MTSFESVGHPMIQKIRDSCIDERASLFLDSIKDDPLLLAELRDEKKKQEKGEILMILKCFVSQVIIIFKNKLLDEEDTGSIVWTNQEVELHSPSPCQCRQALMNLTKNHTMISIWSSSAYIVYCLASQLEKIPTVKILWINDTPLTEYSLRFLSKNQTLEGLGIFSNSIDNFLLFQLCKFLQQNTTMTHLNLGDNLEITDLSAKTISDFLRQNTKLVYLSFCGTLVSSKGVKILLKALGENKVLKKLELDIEHEAICSSVSDYEEIKDRLSFFDY